MKVADNNLDTEPPAGVYGDLVTGPDCDSCVALLRWLNGKVRFAIRH